MQPRRINFATGGNIIYIYNAQGVKLQKTVSYPNQTQATTRYRGGFQYDNQTLQFVHTAEGYAKHTPNPSNASAYGAFDYVYNYTDHLGNIRLSYVLDPAGEGLKVMEENHYYPFGLKHSYNLNKRDIGYFDHLLAGTLDLTEDTRRTRMVNNNGYQYKYNGVEYQDELGLNMYSMDMRQYDPAIARWVVQDPVVHFDYSPYSAFDNNPVFFADPSGADSFASTFVDEDGKVIEHRNDSDNNVYLVLDEDNWDGGKNLPIIGKEDPNRKYKKGDIYKYHNGAADFDWGLASIISEFNGELLIAVANDLSYQRSIPVYNEAGKLIGLWRSSAPYIKALRYVGGVLKPIGSGLGVFNNIKNTNDMISGKMSVERWGFGIVGTGASMWVASTAGGPVGVVVGGMFYVGDLFIQAGEISREQAKQASKTNSYKVNNWSDLGKFLNFQTFYHGFKNN